MSTIADNSNSNNNKFRKVDIVIIDDEKFFTDALSLYFQMNNKSFVIDKYYYLEEFLKHISIYPKNARISIDDDFRKGMNGIDLAEQLHKAGYTDLFLVSGKLGLIEKVPDYLIMILKDKAEAFDRLLF